MTNFAQIASEIFEALSPWLGGDDITRLWLCGSHQLNENMKRGYSVTQYRIRMLNSPPIVGFTSLLHFFQQLRVLEITFPDSFHPPIVQGFSIMDLPSTLQRMKLEADKVQTFFSDKSSSEKLMSGLSERFPCLTHLTLLGLNIGGWVGQDMRALPASLIYFAVEHLVAHSSTFNLMLPALQTFKVRDRCEMPKECLEKLPPTLRRLILHGESRIPEDAYKALPPTLEELKIFTAATSSEENLFSSLPRTLNTLSLQCYPADDGYEKKLPPNMTSLYLGVGGRITELSFAGLPRTLTAFSVALSFPISVAGAQDLPPGLTTLILRLCHFETESSAFLPRTLTLLNIEDSDITDDFIPGLPRSLNSLNVGDCSKLTDQCVSALPPSLTELWIGNCDQFTDKACSMLPRTLIRFHTQVESNWSDPILISQLPPSLKTFSAPLLRTLANESIPAFPRSLTSLAIPRCLLLTIDCVPQLPLNLSDFIPPYFSISTKYEEMRRVRGLVPKI